MLGVLLGPGVLGRFAPETHNALFAGDAVAKTQVLLQAHREETTEKLNIFEEMSMTPAAVTEYLQERKVQEEEIKRTAVREKALGVVPWLLGVGLAMLSGMLLEAVFGPTRSDDEEIDCPRGPGLLVAWRYAGAGALAALVLAQPAVFWVLGPVGLAFAIVGTVLAAGLLVLGNSNGSTRFVIDTDETPSSPPSDAA